MLSIRVGAIAAVASAIVSIAAQAQTIVVGTNAEETASYGTTSQGFGPFPWSDLGLTASASVTPGALSVTTGGATTYSFASTVTAGENFVPGSTVLNLGYNAAWTGGFASTSAATAHLASNFQYNFGPISGNASLLNVPLSLSGNSGNLAASVNASVASPVTAQQSGSGPGVNPTLNLQAQACFIGCVTVASASIGANIGTHLQETVIATPTVTYGDLVWASKTPSYSPSDPSTFVAGGVGKVANVFAAPPASLGLSSGQSFYYNILPVVELAMPVANSAQVAVPATIHASWDVFGASGSENWPLGNLYALNTGKETFDFDPTFNGGSFYSIPLEYTAGECVTVLRCLQATYTVLPGSGGSSVETQSGGVPGDGGPCADIVSGCEVDVPLGSSSTGGYGGSNLGPLIPGDPSNSEICGPVGTPYAGECISRVNLTSSVPEPPTALLCAAGLFGVAMARRGRWPAARQPRR